MPTLRDKLKASNTMQFSEMHLQVLALVLGLVRFAYTIKMSALDLLLRLSLALQHGHQIFFGRMQMSYGIRQTSRIHLLHRCIIGMHHHRLDLDYQQGQQDTKVHSSGKMQMLTGVMQEGLCMKVLQVHKLIFQQIKLHLQNHKVCGLPILVTGQVTSLNWGG